MVDDQNMALNETGEVETPADTTPVSEETTVPDSTGEEESRKGATARVREAVNRAKAAEEKAKSLEQQLAELTNQVGSGGLPPFQPQVEPLVKPGEEITAEDLNKRLSEREQRQQQAIEFRLQQERAINHINKQASDLVGQYDFLNPDKPESFNPELSEAVTEAALAFAKANPMGDLKAYVKKIVKPYQNAVTREVTQQTETVAKQVSQAAIRPSQAKTGEKKFEDLTIAEMEERLGFANG